MNLNKQTFVVAVSGGVDSVVLLHKLVAKKSADITYIVAHYDHGMRPESPEDAEFVRLIAKNSQLGFELGQGELGSNASEALAREKRYKFLRTVKQKYDADKIITAHHQDDIIETIVINLLRGTGPRGLMPMLKPSDILRPLLNTTKQQLIDYAVEHELEWREDSTNSDETYLRNYVRKNIAPKMASSSDQLLRIRRRLGDIYYEADQLVKLAVPPGNILHRSDFLRYSYSVQREIVRAWLLQMGIDELDKSVIERVALAIKTMQTGKKLDIGNTHWLSSSKQNVQIIKKD